MQTCSACIFIYDTGTEVTVRAYPHTDYEFVAWQSADGEELSGLSEYTFTLLYNERTPNHYLRKSKNGHLLRL